MKKGAQPARAGVPLAVAPKENGPPWRSNDRVFSLIIKRIPPVMSWAHRVRWRGRKPTKIGEVLTDSV
jgi:hypothetical protein